MSSTDVTLGQAFQYEVEKQAQKKQVVFECTERSNPHFRVELVDGIPYIVANRAGMLALAKLLVTIGAGSRWEGLYLQLREDFDGNCEEVLRIRLEESSRENVAPTKQSAH